jgi:hypothetical protein
MAAQSFDATHAVHFDLRNGSIRTGGETERGVLVPSHLLQGLVASASTDASEAFGRGLGTAIGRRARERLKDPGASSLEACVNQLAGQAALAGIGSLAIERWGRALVVLIEGSALAPALLAPTIASLLEATFDRKVWCTLLASEAQVARVLVASEAGVGRVRQWLDEGVPWADALARAQRGKS